MVMRVVLVATIAAAITVGAATQEVADPAASYQLATTLYTEGRYREALNAYEGALLTEDVTLALRARKGKVQAALRVADFDVAGREAAAS